jgi:CDP-diacylglycerol--glycerol-3-phosphate 3-phosphatidyltransferase
MDAGEGSGVSEDSSPESADSGHRMDEGLRWFGDFFFYPFLWFFGKLGISPNVLTVAGMALAMAAGYFLAVKRVPVAAVFFVLSGVFDIVDGYVAKKLGKVTVFGSFLDSFTDRISDAAIYVGLMVYYLRLQEGIYVGLAIVILVASFLISYLRARAEALGLQCKAGLMARAPRFLAVGFGLFFNGLSPWFLKVVMWIVAALLIETLAERFIFVWRELEA